MSIKSFFVIWVITNSNGTENVDTFTSEIGSYIL